MGFAEFNWEQQQLAPYRDMLFSPQQMECSREQLELVSVAMAIEGWTRQDMKHLLGCVVLSLRAAKM
jgi:hypothetical protein